MGESTYTPLNFDELRVVLCVPDSDVDKLRKLLDDLTLRGEIIQTKRNRFALPGRLGFIKGIFRANERGYGFVCIESQEDIFIPASLVNGAMHRDTVLVRVQSKSGADGKKQEGEIVRIIERGNVTVIGRFEQGRGCGYVVPEDKHLAEDIYIPASGIGNAKNGQMVEVRITHYPKGRRGPAGEVTEILGYEDEPGMDVLCILRQYGLSEEFPKKVISSLSAIPDYLTEADWAGRDDFRNETIITIDGADAKDLDDAIHIRKNGDTFTLGVHIADVSHYVTENSPLDQEAFRRGTSVYPVDRVVPMLPKKLSNGICSLNPSVERLTLSVIMDVDQSGIVLSHRICEGVIKTVERMTYEDVTKILEGDISLKKQYKHILPQLRDMAALAKILRKKRMAEGSIDFDFPEAKIVLDQNGDPAEIIKYRPGLANHIIEEFMLLCNQTVAAQFSSMHTPFVYRVHEKPSTDKLNTFNEFLKTVGLRTKSLINPTPKDFARLLEKVKGTAQETLVSQVMLRSLMKARYSPDNLGHFGLAFSDYCHFTSPIRRYPDLLIHRIIKECLVAPLSSKRERYLTNFVNKAAIASSDAEINAQEAEREAEDMKKAAYMYAKIGCDYTGTITSITSFGFFVELENTVEGLVRLSDLDDYYTFAERDMSLIGEHSGKRYQIGDKVNITVARVSVPERQIDFVLND